MKPSQRRISLLFICLLIIALFFQNCGQAGDIQLISADLPSTAEVADYSPQDPPAEPTGPQATPPSAPVPPVAGTNPPMLPPTAPPPMTPPAPYVPPSTVFQVNFSKHQNYVCEPFNPGQASSSGVNGLKATLAFVSPENSNEVTFAQSLKVRDYWQNTSSLIQKSSTPLYFSQINTIPMKFDQGFSASDGKYLVDDDGEKLIEWFGIRYETEFGLAAGDQEGYYKLAVVSDDGVRIDQLINGQWVEILSNDGIHAPKFQCQKKSSELYLTKDTKIKLRIYYYQGPKVIISNVLLFKYIGKTSKATEVISGCELNGTDDIYSDPWQGEVYGQANYTELVDSGWSVVSAKNFYLPNAEVNPCAENDLNLIEDEGFKIEGNKTTDDNGLNFKFLTSIESEAIIKIFDDSQAEPVMKESSVTVSAKNTSGKNQHSINLKQLEKGKSYRMELVFRNADLNISKRIDYLIKPIVP